MRLRILSDLHLEAASLDPPPVEADVVVLAGDIDNGAQGIAWAQAQFDRPVLYVPGNHEFYDGELGVTLEQIHAAARGSNVTVLDCAERIVGGVRFLGCTLWTDFDLPVAMERKSMLALARSWITDFRAIRCGEKLLTPEDTMALHARQRAWLSAALAADYAGATVVITHHAPHPRSVAPQFAGHPANPGFVSDLTPLMGRAVLWIHGHTHTSFDYAVKSTRVVCNPRGYPGETTGFRPDFVATI